MLVIARVTAITASFAAFKGLNTSFLKCRYIYNMKMYEYARDAVDAVIAVSLGMTGL